MRAPVLVGFAISLSVAGLATAGPVHVMVVGESPALVQLDGVAVEFPPGQSGPVEASEVSVGASDFPVTEHGGFLHLGTVPSYFPAVPHPDQLLVSVMLCFLFGGVLFLSLCVGYRQ